MEQFYIYKITNTINNKIYIGQTNDFNRRKSQYKHACKEKPDQLITKAMLKYGFDNFLMEIIDTVNTREEANAKEEEYMVLYDSRNLQKGYNIATGGGVFGTPDYIRNKISASLKEHYKHNVSKRKGKPFTQEHKDAISRASMGKKGTNLGKKFTQEHRDKIRIANTNKTHTPETRAKLALLKKGITPTNAKLNFSIATEIRQSKLKNKELAVIYNVSCTTISDVRRNRIFIDKNYIPKPCKSTNKKLTNEQACEIRNSNLTVKELATKYNVSKRIIKSILSGDSYK